MFELNRPVCYFQTKKWIAIIHTMNTIAGVAVAPACSFWIILLSLEVLIIDVPCIFLYHRDNVMTRVSNGGQIMIILPNMSQTMYTKHRRCHKHQQNQGQHHRLRMYFIKITRNLYRVHTLM